MNVPDLKHDENKPTSVGLESDEVRTRQATGPLWTMIGKGGRNRTVPILSAEVGDIRPRFVQLDEMWAPPTRGNRT